MTPYTFTTDSVLRLYHGSDSESIKYIAANGIQYESALELGDGNFWATPDVDTAKWFAQVNPKGGDPMVLHFELGSSLVLHLQSQDPPHLLEHVGGVPAYEFFPDCFEVVNSSMRNVHTIAF